MGLSVVAPGASPSLARIAAVPGLRLGVPSLLHFAGSDRPFDLFPDFPGPSVPIASLTLPCDATRAGGDAAAAASSVVDLEDVGPWGALSDGAGRELGSDRLRFGNANVLVARLRPYLGKAFHNDDPGRIGSPEWIALCIDEDRYRPRLLARLLQTTAFRRVARVFMSGKEHPRIAPEVLGMLRVPTFSLAAQDALLADLDALASEAAGLGSRLGRCTSVVDEVFAREFGLDVADLDEQKQQRAARISVTDVAASRGARFGWRHNSPGFRYALGRLRSLPGARVGDALATPIILGAGISPAEYDPAGHHPYVSMATIKTWAFDEEAAATVTGEFYERMEKKRAVAGDIVMARSGEGTIGKVALLPDGAEGIFADFTMRIRLDPETCHATFAYAYFMTSYFQELVAGEKMGLGNNTNIYPDQISRLPLPLPDLPSQGRIAAEVDRRLAEFTEARGRIARLHVEMGHAIVAAAGMRPEPVAALAAPGALLPPSPDPVGPMPTAAVTGHRPSPAVA